MKAPVYIVKPKNVFKHPFNKFDLDKPTTRETQNEDLTDYFNYGFNEDTMNIYGKLVKRTIETLDESINPEYFDAPSMLMRLNDEIPMDFGGFCKFFDKSVFSGKEDDEEGLQNMENFHNGDELFEYLICLVMGAKPEYPLIDFVHNLYRIGDDENDSELCDIVDQIQKNLERKYQDVMEKLYEKKNNPVPAVTTSKNNQFRKNEKPSKSEQKKESPSSSEDSRSSRSDSDDSDESDRRRTKDRKRKSKSRGKERERSRDKKSHKKIKKDSKKKDKDRKRSYSRDKHRKKSKSERKDKHDKHKKHRR